MWNRLRVLIATVWTVLAVSSVLFVDADAAKLNTVVDHCLEKYSINANGNSTFRIFANYTCSYNYVQN